MHISEDFCVARYRHGEISGTTLAGLEFGQLEFVNEPNVSTPIQGSSSVVKDLHGYKASTICTCYKVLALYPCRSFTTDEDP